MKRFSVCAIVIVVALSGAGCGSSDQRDTGLGALVRAHVCGPYTPSGRPVRKGCTIQRIPVAALRGIANLHDRWEVSGHPAAGARLAGVVEVCGDPTLQKRVATPVPYPCTLQEGQVHVLGASGRLVARARLVDARFLFVLRPGRYRLIAWNIGNGPFKEWVTLRSGQTTVADVVIQAI
jgi:hypothetical protein